MAKAPLEPDNSRYTVDESKQKSARRWFEQAAKLVDQRNYSYAIKSFVEGLSLNPEAVEQGWIPLRGCAIVRWQTGGKKPSMVEAMKYSTTAKDPIKAMVNAGWLMAHDPTNTKYVEGLVRNANKAHCDSTLFWIGPIYRELLVNEKKPDVKKFLMLKEVYEELGDRCQAREELTESVKAYELGLDALTAQRSMDPDNRSLDNILRDLSTKLTILKGRYDTAERFEDSIQDRDQQARLHDDDRMVQDDTRLAASVERARVEMEANPEVDAKVMTYIDLLCKTENDENEKLAIRVLTERFRASGHYRFKQRGDDIAIRQLTRHARAAKASGDNERSKELQARRLKFELKVYRERVDTYPTDLRLKHDYAKRLFMCRQFDEAIPLFQQARQDPKVRTSSNLHLGRCFFEMQLFDQAAEVLQEAADQYELTDETSKEIDYWLARSLESAGKVPEARKAYGKLMQIDYNYRDIRDRMKSLT